MWPFDIPRKRRELARRAEEAERQREQDLIDARTKAAAERQSARTRQAAIEAVQRMDRASPTIQGLPMSTRSGWPPDRRASKREDRREDSARSSFDDSEPFSFYSALASTRRWLLPPARQTIPTRPAVPAVTRPRRAIRLRLRPRPATPAAAAAATN